MPSSATSSRQTHLPSTWLLTAKPARALHRCFQFCRPPPRWATRTKGRSKPTRTRERRRSIPARDVCGRLKSAFFHTWLRVLHRISVSPRLRFACPGRLFDQFLDHLVEHRRLLVARTDADKSHDAAPIDQKAGRDRRNRVVPIVLA